MIDMIDGVVHSPLTCVSELQGHLLRRFWVLPSSYRSTILNHSQCVEGACQIWRHRRGPTGESIVGTGLPVEVNGPHLDGLRA